MAPPALKSGVALVSLLTLWSSALAYGMSPAENLGRLAAESVKRFGPDTARQVSYDTTNWPYTVPSLVKVHQGGLAILREPTMRAPMVGVVGITRAGEILQLFQEKRVQELFVDPLDRRPSSNGTWYWVMLANGKAGWLLGQPARGERLATAIPNPMFNPARVRWEQLEAERQRANAYRARLNPVSRLFHAFNDILYATANNSLALLAFIIGFPLYFMISFRAMGNYQKPLDISDAFFGFIFFLVVGLVLLGLGSGLASALYDFAKQPGSLSGEFPTLKHNPFVTFFYTIYIPYLILVTIAFFGVLPWFVKAMHYLFVPHPAAKYVNRAVRSKGSRKIDSAGLADAMHESAGLGIPPEFVSRNRQRKADALKDRLRAEKELMEEAIRRERTRGQMNDKR